MANKKITELTSYTNPDATQDVLPIVDVGNGMTKKITRDSLLGITSAPTGISDSQTLSNKTLTNPTINAATLSGTIAGTYTIGGTPTFPATVVTTTASQTLTNKVLTSPVVNTATIANPTLTVDSIAEYTGANGVTIDGLSIKDSKLNTNNSVVTANITNASITPDKMALSPLANYTATEDSIVSVAYAAMPTPQSVTVTIGANGLALVIFTAGLYNVATVKRLSVAVSGATTVAASNNWSIRNDASAYAGHQSAIQLFTGLNAGSNTFSLQAFTASGTAKIFERSLTVIPL